MDERPVAGNTPDGRGEAAPDRRLVGRVAGMTRMAAALGRPVGLENASVSRAADGRLAGVLHASSTAAGELIELQETLGEGPTLLAAEAGAPVLVEDLTTSPLATLWVMFAREAAARGIQAVYAFPLQVGAVALGVLTLHGNRPTAGLTADTLGALLRVRDAVSMILLSPAGKGYPTQWGDLLTSRHAATNQAAGMVMVQAGSSLEDAIARMQAYALATGITLATLGEQVVSGETKFGDGGGRPAPERDNR